MRRRVRHLLGAVAVAMIAITGMACREGRAESLITSLSAPKVSITSNFTGAEIVVFGAVERDAATVARPDPYDIVVVVSGPPEDMVTRRKDRFLGVWVNRGSMTFLGVPSFYAVHTTRALDDIASPGVLKRWQIGIDNLILPAAIGESEQFEISSDFRKAYTRLKRKDGLYEEKAKTVEFLSNSLFRTSIPLPANVPDGAYKVSIHLFRGGALLASQDQVLSIAKSGFEQITYTLAQEQSVLYGLATVLMALMTGWLAGVIFRKD